MKWYRNFFVGESIDSSREEIMEQISVKKKVSKRFLIILPANKENLLEIVTAGFGISINWREVFVIGVSGSRKEAVGLVSEIISLIYEQTGMLAIEDFFDDYI